jgi:hypothetical protein
MFDVDKQWLERLYQAIYHVDLIGKDDLLWELKGLEIKFFKLELEDFEWARLGEIEDELYL